MHVTPWGSRAYRFGRLEVYLVKRLREERIRKVTLRLGRRYLELSW